MIVDSKIGQTFDSLAQRVIYVFLGTFPRFVPLPDEVSEGAQRQMHDFLLEILRKSYADPALLGLPVEPDTCGKSDMSHEESRALINTIRKLAKSILSFYNVLQQIGITGEVDGAMLHVEKSGCRIASKTLAQLERFGMHSKSDKTAVVLWSDAYPDIAPAWKLLSAIADRYSQSLQPPYQRDGLLAFIHGIFNTDDPHLSEAFAALSGDEGRYRTLEAYLQDHGYRRVGSEVFTPGGKPDMQIAVSWHKPYNAKDGGGVQIGVNFFSKDQLYFELKVPRFREIVLQFEQVDDGLKDMVIACTRPCNDCGYCIQTNKARRQIMAFTVDHRGKRYRNCPFFPSLSWTSLDEATVSGMQKMLQYAETLFRVKEDR